MFNDNFASIANLSIYMYIDHVLYLSEKYRDETEEYNGVIFIFEPGYSLCIIPVFNNSSAVTLDGQQLTSPKNVNDCCRLTLNNSTNILIRYTFNSTLFYTNMGLIM